MELKLNKLKKENNFYKKLLDKKKEDILNKPSKYTFYAIIFNKNEFQCIKKFNINDEKFKYMGHTYIINFENVMLFRIKGFFTNKIYVMYELSNKEPLQIKDNNVQPKYLSSVEIDAILETKIIKDVANHTGNLDIQQFIRDNIVYIAIGVIGIIIYVVTGGTMGV